MMTVFILFMSLQFMQCPARTAPLCSIPCQVGQFEGWHRGHAKFAHAGTCYLSWEVSETAGVP